MAFDLPLSRKLAKSGWKVKIRDKERLEEPHVTLLRGTKAWRIGLRSGQFLDGGRWRDFPDDLREAVMNAWSEICRTWDEMYPENPVPSEEDEDTNEVE